jgi:hypothetical protein
MPDNSKQHSFNDQTEPPFASHSDGGMIAWVAEDLSVHVGRDGIVTINGPVDSQLVIQVGDAPYLADVLAQVEAAFPSAGDA